MWVQLKFRGEFSRGQAEFWLPELGEAAVLPSGTQAQNRFRSPRRPMAHAGLLAAGPYQGLASSLDWTAAHRQPQGSVTGIIYFRASRGATSARRTSDSKPRDLWVGPMSPDIQKMLPHLQKPVAQLPLCLVEMEVLPARALAAVA